MAQACKGDKREKREEAERGRKKIDQIVVYSDNERLHSKKKQKKKKHEKKNY